MKVITCATVFQILLLGVYSSDVRLPPTIIKSPQEVKIYRLEDRFTLECLATGNPKPQYEWLKDGNILNIPSPNGHLHQIIEGTFEIFPLTNLDEGYYQCTAFNQYGKTLSKVTNLRRAVLSSQNSIEVAESRLIEEGEPYTITCNPSKYYPKPSYSWAIAKTVVDDSQTPIVLGKRIQIDENGNLYFTYVLKSDAHEGKLYKCNMYNSYLDVQMGGSYSRLNVKPSASGVLRKKPPTLQFSSQSTVIALEGHNVSLRCFFAGNPVPSVGWKRLGQNHLPVGRFTYSSFNTELIIHPVNQTDEGKYECSATNSEGSNPYVIYIDVQAAPVFLSIQDRPHNVNVTDGDSVIINCKAHADPEAEVIWLRNGEHLDFEKYPKYRLSDDRRQLKISNLCKDCQDFTSDLAVIQCNASNVHGSAFADGYINILKRTEIGVKPQDVTVEKGVLTAKFDCVAYGDDSTAVSIDWYHVSTQDDMGDKKLRNVSNFIMIGTDSSLTFNVDNYTDWIPHRGRYRCVAKNAYSTDTAEATLELEELPERDDVLVDAGLDLWLILILVAAILFLLIFLICCCLCLQRNKGDTYPVDEKERKNGNNPEKELADGGFHDYQRPEGEPLKGSRASLSSSIKIDSDEEASLNEYGDLDAGKFTEDGSFIGDYGVDRRRGKAADHKV